MRRIKQAEENINKLAQWFNKLCGICDRLKAADKTKEQTIETLQKELEKTKEDVRRNGNHIVGLDAKLQDQTNTIKELSKELSATNVRIGRIENPPKFKEGNTVEEKSPDPYDLMGFVIVPCGTSTWISRSGTVVSWSYKQPGDVLATYKILAEDKKDVFELQENLLKLATTKEGETKKSKK